MVKAKEMNLTAAIGEKGVSSEGKPVSAEYRNVIAKDGFPTLGPITTLYELWVERWVLSDIGVVCMRLCETWPQSSQSLESQCPENTYLPMVGAPRQRYAVRTRSCY